MSKYYASAASVLAALFTVSVSSTPLLAQSRTSTLEEDGETIVVTASSVPLKAVEVGSAITILDAEDLLDRQITLISDALRDVPGLAVSRTGPVGGFTQVRIRGAEANQTLVLIDGIEANDPFFSEFDFANLVTSDVARIEVLRGPQSALYGSEALGGVISVLTQSPEPGFQSSGDVEAGSFGTYRVGANAGGGTETIRAFGSVSFYDTQGISAAPDGDEEDGYENLTAFLKVEADPLDILSVRGVLRYVDADVETDAQDFTPGSPTQGLVIDADQIGKTERLLAGGDATLTLLDGALLATAFGNYLDSEVRNFSGGFDNGTSQGERIKYGARLTGFYQTGPLDHALTIAGEREDLEFENIVPGFTAANQTQTDNQTSVIAEYNGNLNDRIFLSASVRHDMNDLFDDATTYRVTAAYRLIETGTRFHASYGTGITDPTFFERFGFTPGTFIGNPDLTPERSRSFDIGVEQRLFEDRVLIDVTYFNANLEDEITTLFLPPDFLATPVNQAEESERQGVEVTFEAALLDTLRLSGQYTYLDAEDPDGLAEVRRPDHTAAANLTWAFHDGRGTFDLGVDYNGEMEDLEFIFATPETRVSLDSFVLVNIAASYQLNDWIAVFARGENLLDEDYQEIFGYAAPGIAGFAGIRARI